MSTSPIAAGCPKSTFVRFCFALLLLAACLPDTEGFGDELPADGAVTSEDLGAERDAARVDAALVDGAVTDGGARDAGPEPVDPCLPEPTCASGCEMPWLLAAVEDLPGAPNCGGRIARWSLATDDEPCLCTGYDAAGQLSTNPLAVGFVPPSTIVAVGNGGDVVAIDAATDRPLWTVPFEGLPSDVFALEDLEGNPTVGIGVLSGTDMVNTVWLIDARAEADHTPIVRRVGDDLGLGLSVVSITQSSTDRRRLRALDQADEAALDLNPWTGAYGDPPYVLGRDGRFLSTVQSSFVGGFHRTVWSGIRTDQADRPSYVWSLYRGPADATGGHAFPVGARCLTTDEGADYGMPCTFLDAVPDPHTFNGVIALCERAGSRRITRVRVTDQCLDYAEQSDLFGTARIARIALAVPTHWNP